MLVLLLAATGLFWWYLFSSGEKLRGETLKQAELRALQVNTALAEAVSMLFFNIDEAAHTLVQSYRAGSMDSLQKEVDSVYARFPEGALLQIAVIGADGYASYSSLGLKEKVFLGDREHFKVHVQASDTPLFVSRPVLGRVSQKWSIQFSKAIRSEGRLQGVVVISVSPSYLQHTLVKLSLGTHDASAIIRVSGETLARDKNLEDAIRSSTPVESPFLGASPGSSGTYTTLSPVDQTRRILHWIRLPEYPVVVMLGLSSEEVLRPVNEAIDNDQFKAVLASIALWLMTIVMFFLLTRVQAQRERRMAFEYAAQHDHLTGLTNRAGLVEKLETIVKSNATSKMPFAVLFMDLDGFKTINDQHGHAVGDEVLKAAAGRIKGCVRNEDVVARMGGDEFVVIDTSTRSATDTDTLVSRIQRALRAPFSVEDQQLSVGISIGSAAFPADGTTADALLLKADQSMYRAKHGKTLI